MMITNQRRGLFLIGMTLYHCFRCLRESQKFQFAAHTHIVVVFAGVECAPTQQLSESLNHRSVERLIE